MRLGRFISNRNPEAEMPTTELPPIKEKAHEIARKIANGRPLRKDKDDPDANVTGGFNQKSRPHEDEQLSHRQEEQE